MAVAASSRLALRGCRDVSRFQKYLYKTYRTLTGSGGRQEI